MHSLIEIEFTLPDPSGEIALPLLTQLCPQGWEEKNGAVSTKYRIHLPDRDLAGEFARKAKQLWPETTFILREQKQENWATSWKDFFLPVSCGEIFEIVPPWLADKGTAHKKTIIIEPKMAFGTGHHPTTALCLEHLAVAKRTQQTRFLDLGTGSGILSIALAMLGCKGIGLDIDPDTVPCATENMANKVSQNIDFRLGSIDSLPMEAQFEIIVANILSGPLIELAPLIIPHFSRTSKESRCMLHAIRDGVSSNYHTR